MSKDVCESWGATIPSLYLFTSEFNGDNKLVIGKVSSFFLVQVLLLEKPSFYHVNAGGREGRRAQVT